MNKDDYNDWREALLRLPDRTFFNLIRLYLGEIKTPFNKQRLIERLIGFLSKPEIHTAMLRSLDNLDVLILTAVHILPKASRNELLHFFSSEFYVQTRLINMEERLLIYCSNSAVNKKVYKINPLLSKVVEPLLDSKFFFLPEQTAEPEYQPSITDDITLAGIYTFFLNNTAALKTNGTFKLKILKQLQTVFPEATTDLDRFDMLCTGLHNIGLLLKTDTSFIPQQERWEEFFKQQPFDRKMYLAAASCGQSRRELLHRRAQFFADFVTALDPCGIYSDEILKRFFYYVVQKNMTEVGTEISFFHDNRTIFEREIIEIMKTLGFLLSKGGGWQLNAALFSQESVEQPLIVSPSFEVTILPYTSFSKIFPVLNCMEPVSILTTGRFEVTRQACARCFEQHDTETTIIATLSQATGNMLPQNIQVSISEWYLKYTAVRLYHGFVISVAEEKQKIFQQNVELQGIIYKELAAGVYLIKHIDLEAIRTIIKSAGLDVTFYANPDVPHRTATRFAAVKYRPLSTEALSANPEYCKMQQYQQEQAYHEHSKMLEEMLETMSLSYEDKRNIKDKITKKLILTKDQLYSTFNDNETREVSGLDFLGKIHLAETAISERKLLEIYVDEPEGRRIIAGIPITIEKTADDAVLLIQMRDSPQYERVSIARTVKMVALRDSLFS